MIGAYSEASQGFGSDDFEGYDTARGFFLWFVFVIATLII